MKLNDFINLLNKIEKEHGKKIEVVMADNIPVVEPVFLNDFKGEKVVITDEK